MPVFPAAWVSADEILTRIETLRSRYAGNPLIERIDHSFGSDWSGDPAIFLKVILTPGHRDDPMLSSLADELRRDLLRVVHSEDIGLYTYLNFVSTS
jgi:hypothetical protein